MRALHVVPGFAEAGAALTSHPGVRHLTFTRLLPTARHVLKAAAVALANDSPYGLACGVWTRDLRRAHVFARDIEAGQVLVNTLGVGGAVEIPFGGDKKSGIGREKGIAGFLEYTQLENVCINLAQ